MASSFLNNSTLPNGMRRNNPGNLRPLGAGELWEGEIRPGGKKQSFSIFKNIVYGLRGMITDVTGKIAKKNLDTLRKLIHVYAPPSENNTTLYVNNVARATGLKPDQRINLSKDLLHKIILAKIIQEQGSKSLQMISADDFEQAYSLLDPKVKAWLKMPAQETSVKATYNWLDPFNIYAKPGATIYND